MDSSSVKASHRGSLASAFPLFGSLAIGLPTFAQMCAPELTLALTLGSGVVGRLLAAAGSKTMTRS